MRRERLVFEGDFSLQGLFDLCIEAIRGSGAVAVLGSYGGGICRVGTTARLPVGFGAHGAWGICRLASGPPEPTLVGDGRGRWFI